MIHGEAVVLIDGHFFLIGTADRKIGNVLLAANVGTRTQGNTTKNTGFERMFTALSEIEFASDRASYGNRIFHFTQNKQLAIIYY